MMPAQLERLGEAKIHLLAAYVYGLGGGTPPVSQAAVAVIEPKAQVLPLTKAP